MKLNKKGGIPAINEIVMTFLNITPKPILALIFILLITVIAGFVIPTLLSTFGYSCIERGTGDIELYQVPMSSFAEKNFLDIKQGLQGLVGYEEYSLPSDPFPNGNKNYLRIPDQCFVETSYNNSQVYGYIGACVYCDLNTNFFTGFFTPITEKICVGDSTGIRNWVTDDKLCAICTPPYPYYYNHTICTNSTECYFTISDPSLVSYINEDYVSETDYKKIIDLGGVLRPQDDSEIVNIQCTENKKPSLYFFSIELFNKTMWVLLLLGFAIVSFALAWYSVVL